MKVEIQELFVVRLPLSELAKIRKKQITAPVVEKYLQNNESQTEKKVYLCKIVFFHEVD